MQGCSVSTAAGRHGAGWSRCSFRGGAGAWCSLTFESALGTGTVTNCVSARRCEALVGGGALPSRGWEGALGTDCLESPTLLVWGVLCGVSGSPEQGAQKNSCSSCGVSWC